MESIMIPTRSAMPSMDVEQTPGAAPRQVGGEPDRLRRSTRPPTARPRSPRWARPTPASRRRAQHHDDDPLTQGRLAFVPRDGLTAEMNLSGVSPPRKPR